MSSSSVSQKNADILISAWLNHRSYIGWEMESSAFDAESGLYVYTISWWDEAYPLYLDLTTGEILEGTPKMPITERMAFERAWAKRLRRQRFWIRVLIIVLAIALFLAYIGWFVR